MWVYILTHIPTHITHVCRDTHAGSEDSLWESSVSFHRVNIRLSKETMFILVLLGASVRETHLKYYRIETRCRI